MTRFKQGDRIAVYGPRGRNLTGGGTVGEAQDRTIGHVTAVGRLGTVVFRGPDGDTYLAHPNQCRHLRPRRRIWLPDQFHHEYLRIFHSLEEASKAENAGPVVEFVEVRKRGRHGL